MKESLSLSSNDDLCFICSCRAGEQHEEVLQTLPIKDSLISNESADSKKQRLIISHKASRNVRRWMPVFACPISPPPRPGIRARTKEAKAAAVPVERCHPFIWVNHKRPVRNLFVGQSMPPPSAPAETTENAASNSFI